MCIPERNCGGLSAFKSANSVVGDKNATCWVRFCRESLLVLVAPKKQQYQNLSIIGNKMFM